MFANPFFGRLSDRTSSRLGMRRPWMVIGLAGGSCGILIVAVGPSIAVVLIGWCIAQLFFNALLAALVAVLPDQVPIDQRGTVSGVLGVCLPIASVTGTFLVQLFTGNQLTMFLAPCGIGGFFVLLFAVTLKDRRLTKADRPTWSLREFAGTFYVNPRKNPDFGWAAQARGDAAATAEHARHALDLTGPDDHLARGGAAGFLGLAAWANGDVTSALETFTQAVASLHAADTLVDELSSTVTLADMWLAAGRPSKARRLYQGALKLGEEHGQRVADATNDLHVGISEIDVEVGDLQNARRHLEIAAAVGDRSPQNERRYRWFVAMGLLAHADGDPEAAVDHLTQAEQLYQPTFLPTVQPIAAIKARVRIAQGGLSEAADWARHRGASTADDASYLR
jgi:hypothetical protein